jgi:hypothetical protein
MSTSTPAPSPSQLASSRQTLHLIAAHVLGRRRYDVVGRFGLRASPGGFATPSFGPEPETVRVAGGRLVREIGGECASTRIFGASLRSLAEFSGADIDSEFSCGADTPAFDDPDQPLALDPAAAGQIARWFSLGWCAIDQVAGDLGDVARPTTLQLWPEHFDAATAVGPEGGERVNLGVSGGDSFEGEPYLYVGPWTASRPGGGDYWNAPFGAVLRSSGLIGASDLAGACDEFLLEGLRRLGL